MRIQDKEPTFVLGVPKSGTTLMTALLDNHDDLLVFPEHCNYLAFPVEGKVHEDILKSLFRPKKIPRFHNQAILADQVNKEKKDYSLIDYGQFSRSTSEYYYSLTDKQEGKNTAAPALLALMHGFADVTDKRVFKRWVLKRPKYEFQLDKIIDDFPKAKFLYLLRNPAQSSLSRSLKRKKKGQLKNVQAGFTHDELIIGKPRVNFSDLLEWKKSVSQIEVYQKKYASQILVVRYEELTHKPKEVMGGVADFLEISWQSNLLIPTFMGKPWAGNSMRDRKFSAVENNPPKAIPEHIQWQIQSVLGQTIYDWGYIPEKKVKRINIRGLLTLLPGEDWKTAIRNRISFILQNRSKHQR